MCNIVFHMLSVLSELRLNICVFVSVDRIKTLVAMMAPQT